MSLGKSSFPAFHPQRQKGYNASGFIYLWYISTVIPRIIPLIRRDEKAAAKEDRAPPKGPSRNLSKVSHLMTCF